MQDTTFHSLFSSLGFVPAAASQRTVSDAPAPPLRRRTAQSGNDGQPAQRKRGRRGRGCGRWKRKLAADADDFRPVPANGREAVFGTESAQRVRRVEEGIARGEGRVGQCVEEELFQ